MVAYLEKAKGLMETFRITSIKAISQSKNANTDALAELASTRDSELLDAVSVEFLVKPKATTRNNGADTRTIMDGSHHRLSEER